jgi:nucleoside-diphosphate-sugar epimerase
VKNETSKSESTVDKILVTGATGFVGGALARHLKRLGYDVYATGRKVEEGQALIAEGIHFLPAELSEQKPTEALCEGKEFVVHCAGLSSVWGSLSSFWNANVKGTEHIVSGCLRHGVKRLVHISTPSIYFTYKDRLNVKEEEELPKPINAYALTKREAEVRVLDGVEKGLDAVMLRPRGVFGVGDNAILPRIIQALERGLPVVGKGENLADLTYIDNVLDAIVLALHTPLIQSGRVFNVSNGEPVRFWDVIKQIAETLQLPQPKGIAPYILLHNVAWGLEYFHRLFKLKQEPRLTRYGVGILGKSYTLNIERAQKELNYTPKISVKEGLNRFLQAWREANEIIAR